MQKILDKMKEYADESSSCESWNEEADRLYNERERDRGVILREKSSDDFYRTYRIVNYIHKSIESFLKASREKAMSILSINKKVIYTLGITLGKMREDGTEQVVDHYLNQPAFVLLTPEDFEKSYDNLFKIFSRKLAELEALISFFDTLFLFFSCGYTRLVIAHFRQN